MRRRRWSLAFALWALGFVLGAMLVDAVLTGSEALAHHRAAEPSPAALERAYPRLYAAAVRSPRVHAGRDVVAHGRPADGAADRALVRAEARRLYRALRPGPEAEHRRRARAAAAVAVPAHLVSIRACESGHDYRAVSGHGWSPYGRGLYRGAYQFDVSTWRSVGGQGDPAAASRAEQDRRAVILYQRRGAAPWPVCRYR